MNTSNSEEHKKIASFYNKVYYRNIPSMKRVSRHIKNLAKILGIKKDQRVLDIGCGSGEWLSAVEQIGAIPYGTDISEKAINNCKTRIPSGEFSVGVAENLQYDTDKFDLVTCLGSLEHFLDQEKALKEIVRVSKKDAFVLILVPNSGFLTYKLGLYKGTNQASIRETIRSLDEWENMFNNAGLTVIKRWKDLHVFNLGWMIRKPWLLIPLRIIQATLLLIWPLSWQYQIYHLCRVRSQNDK